MELLPGDVQYLNERGIEYEVVDTIDNKEPVLLLILKNQKISSIYDHEIVDILVKIRKGYPISAMDMFWVKPEIKYTTTGNYPENADLIEKYNGSSWQRFSRHYQWKPTYSLANHLHVVKQVLQGERS